MTIEFLEGKRKKFISPVTLFLFFNLIYFFVNPLTDYSLPLYDQIYSQPYSFYTKDLVDAKLEAEGLSEQSYGIIYQNTSDSISKTIMIINVPIIAFFIYLISFRRRPYYFDSLIFAFHFFTLLIFSLVMLDWVGRLLHLFISDGSSIVYLACFSLFILIIPLIYAILGIKKFLKIQWYWSIPAGMVVLASVLVANIIYRFIIFMVSFWAT